jgi:hypothetical protein
MFGHSHAGRDGAGIGRALCRVDAQFGDQFSRPRRRRGGHCRRHDRYVIGRSIGLGLLVRYGRYVRLDEHHLKVGQYLFLRHGGKIVFFGRFVALLRTFAAVLAGANRMSAPHFLFMNALGGICWALLFGGGAYLIGEQIERVAGPVGVLLLIVAIGFVIAGIIYFRRHEKELEQRAERAIPGPLLGALAKAQGVDK